jgi:hypothetical protein
MMIISIMLFEFQHTAMVERKLAYNELNQLQAYYLAKSGVRMGLLRLGLYGRVRKSPQVSNYKKTVPNMDMYLDQIWGLPLPPFPPDKKLVEKLDNQDQNAAEKVLQQTKVSDGKSTHVITSEANKLNLNMLIIPSNLKIDRISFSGPPQGPFHFTGMMLINFLEDLIKQSDDPNEEYPDLKPEELVLNIMDWVNPGTTSFNGGAKDGFYEQQKPPYKAKKARLYSVEELRLVKGMTERIFQKLKPYVTVYSSQGKLNINTLTAKMIKMLHKDITDDDVKKIGEEKAKRDGLWPDVKTFADFISTTLGRANFKTTYPTPEDYLTTNNQSFVIEAMGSLDKSKSQIQKIIKVAVILAKPKGGTVDDTIKDKPNCDKAGKFWYTAAGGRCINYPTNQEECRGIAGEWRLNSAQNKTCCYVNQQDAPVLEACAPDSKAGDTTQEAGAMKILSWSES